MATYLDASMKLFQSYYRLGYFWLLIRNPTIVVSRAGIDVDEPSVTSLNECCLHPRLSAAQRL